MASTPQKQTKPIREFTPQRLDLEQDWIIADFTCALHYPIVLRPRLDGIILQDWVRQNSARLERYLNEHGAILFRGFSVRGREEFQQVIAQVNDRFMLYTDRSSPRTEISNRIYTSTEHPADQYINMHNELAYSQNWPMKIAFYCHSEPAGRGETPIADVRRVLQSLRPETARIFADKGIMYRRHLQEGIGLSWRQVYQTNDKTEVEAKCRANGVEFQWTTESGLIITWVRPAIQIHPGTNEPVWFNHGYFFNSAALNEEVRQAFSSEEELSFDTFFGDGSRIPPDALEEIKKAYDDAVSVFQWRRGDILLLDNMLMAHGRYPFDGPREINVVMCEPRH